MTSNSDHLTLTVFNDQKILEKLITTHLQHSFNPALENLNKLTKKSIRDISTENPYIGHVLRHQREPSYTDKTSTAHTHDISWKPWTSARIDCTEAGRVPRNGRPGARDVGLKPNWPNFRRAYRPVPEPRSETEWDACFSAVSEEARWLRRVLICAREVGPQTAGGGWWVNGRCLRSKYKSVFSDDVVSVLNFLVDLV